MADAVFVSYARRDFPFVRDLVEWLRSHAFVPWIDVTSIGAGENWPSAVAEAIMESSFVLVVLSPHAMRSRRVHDEMGIAFQSRKTVIPVLIQEAKLSEQIAAINWIDFRASFDEGCKVLLAHLRSGDSRPLRSTLSAPRREVRWLGLSVPGLVPSPPTVRLMLYLAGLSFFLKWMWIFVASNAFLSADIEGHSLSDTIVYSGMMCLAALFQFVIAIRAVHRRVTLWEFVVAQFAPIVATLFCLTSAEVWAWQFLCKLAILILVLDSLGIIVLLRYRSFRRWMIAYPFGWGAAD